MSDLVTRIWSGPFEAHDHAMRTIQVGEEIEVTQTQADENPGWFAPLPSSKPAPSFTSDPKPDPPVVEP